MTESVHFRADGRIDEGSGTDLPSFVSNSKVGSSCFQSRALERTNDQEHDSVSSF